jgi:hypothetical protein
MVYVGQSRWEDPASNPEPKNSVESPSRIQKRCGRTAAENRTSENTETNVSARPDTPIDRTQHLFFLTTIPTNGEFESKDEVGNKARNDLIDEKKKKRKRNQFVCAPTAWGRNETSVQGELDA